MDFGYSVIRNDRRDRQIAVGAGRWADTNGFVRHADVQRVRVCIGVDGDRADTHLSGGLDHPTGNFAPIGNQDRVKHPPSPLLLAENILYS